ncbi:hypothetical protein ACCAA_310109 [Candidatus Accumulibacter aalborgensis]|uniref:Uncharacterized protein n=1 Tax=Candidatus Accumulibacter aalborgensis TaxID=1860102 RepID=A0A1A8XMJ9_9PROT|nr:hypothetical protein ACCAA_310109 [Candidatus Accumulibacter aalborgensis]
MRVSLVAGQNARAPGGGRGAHSLHEGSTECIRAGVQSVRHRNAVMSGRNPDRLKHGPVKNDKRPGSLSDFSVPAKIYAMEVCL